MTPAIVTAAGGAWIRCVASASPPALILSRLHLRPRGTSRLHAGLAWNRAPRKARPAPSHRRRVCKGTWPPPIECPAWSCGHGHRVSLLLGERSSCDQQGLSVLGLRAGPAPQTPASELRPSSGQEVTPQGVPIQLEMGSGPPGGGLIPDSSAHLCGAHTCHLTLSPGAPLTESPSQAMAQASTSFLEAAGRGVQAEGCRLWGLAQLCARGHMCAVQACVYMHMCAHVHVWLCACMLVGQGQLPVSSFLGECRVSIDLARLRCQEPSCRVMGDMGPPGERAWAEGVRVRAGDSWMGRGPRTSSPPGCLEISGVRSRKKHTNQRGWATAPPPAPLPPARLPQAGAPRGGHGIRSPRHSPPSRQPQGSRPRSAPACARLQAGHTAPMSSPRLPGRCRSTACPATSKPRRACGHLTTDPQAQPPQGRLGFGSAGGGGGGASLRHRLRSYHHPPLGHPGGRALSTWPDIRVP